ncbi:MAG TPA: hypothetical protein VF950_14760 [Planctomycetota bacterium]
MLRSWLAALRKWIRTSAGLYISLAFAVSLGAQDVPKAERIRFLDGRAELCEVLGKDGDGVTLKLPGVPRPLKFPWWQIDPADAARLRGGDGAAKPVPAAEFAVDGVRVRLADGKVVDGVLMPGAPANEVWIRNAEGKHVLPAGQVASREDVRLELRLVYGADEIATILTGRIKPSTAEEFDRLGAELQRARLEERAMAAFRMAELLRHPEWPEAAVAAELVKLRDRIEDLAVRRAVYQAQESWLSGDYDAALARMDAVEAGLGAEPGAAAIREELRRLRSLIQDLRGRARDEGIVREGWRAAEALLKAKAMDRSSSWVQARAWVEERLPGELLAHLRRRFNFTPDDPALAAAWERRPPEPVWKHPVDEASWITLRPEARDPETWWRAADDSARYRALKAEWILKHLPVLRSDLKSCAVCGGTGLEAAGGSCSACLGLKEQRVLFYR